MINNEIVFKDIEQELIKARFKFPYTEHMMNALTEEVGELAQALLHLQYETGDSQHVYEEAIQVATMAIRVASEGDSTFPAYNEWVDFIHV